MEYRKNSGKYESKVVEIQSMLNAALDNAVLLVHADSSLPSLLIDSHYFQTLHHRDYVPNGWNKINADGYFGDITERSVRSFQDFLYITQNGIVGDTTYFYLLQLSSINSCNVRMLGTPVSRNDSKVVPINLLDKSETKETYILSAPEKNFLNLFKGSTIKFSYSLWGWLTEDKTEETLNMVGRLQEIKDSLDLQNRRYLYIYNNLQKGTNPLFRDFDTNLGTKLGIKIAKMPVFRDNLKHLRTINNNIRDLINEILKNATGIRNQLDILKDKVIGILKECCLFLKQILKRIGFNGSNAGKLASNFVDWFTKNISKFKFLKAIPAMRIASCLTLFTKLIKHIFQGDLNAVMIDLVAIVKDIFLGVTASILVTTLMACGLGELAFAVVILAILLDYLFDEYMENRLKESLKYCQG